MSSLKRMGTVSRLMEYRQLNTERSLKAGREELNQLSARLDDLLAYREDYVKEFNTTAAKGANAHRLLGYQQFLGGLNEAIQKQIDIMRAAQLEVRQRERRWIEAQRRRQAVERVSERYVATERAQEDRREQREADDRRRK